MILPMVLDQLGREIREGITEYASVIDQASRTSVQAKVLYLLDQLKLSRAETVLTRRVSARELSEDPFLRGATVIHLDLVFRSSVTAAEVIHTAEHGLVMIATHPHLLDLPIGVILAQPTTGLVRERHELFDLEQPPIDEADVMMPYALAASPPRLGAGVELLHALMDDCGELSSPPRVVTFSPLTGMRAHVIRLVDEAWLPLEREYAANDPELDAEQLRGQLLDLLAEETLPSSIPEPTRSWLVAESRSFADSEEYGVGNFHRSMGAPLVGLAQHADPKDSDALWARTYFDYGRPKSAA